MFLRRLPSSSRPARRPRKTCHTKTVAPAGERLPGLQASGSISGTVIDQFGAVAVGARVQLTREDQAPTQEILSGYNGQFSSTGLTPGPFRLTITSAGFENQVFSGNLRAGEAFIAPEFVLAVAPAVEEVRVALTQFEVAQEQIKEQEKQRVLCFIPNFYVTYVPDAAPLAPKQKFELAWKSVSDPITIVGVGALTGIEQAADQYGGYGQGAQGYAKRFGATYGDVFIGTFIDSAILTSVLKQDPRYFYRGTGTTRSGPGRRPGVLQK
ncbi:MAG: carboxypeptidase-like regulatory domain-containing protein [Acidobacteriota bacterium]|nr:carboxypeptidase-like regulatory domain-containing protein [Acidobacteriota bacterium]